MALTSDISPVTLAEADAYHAIRGTPGWIHAASDAAKEAGIVRAIDFLSIDYTLVDGVDWTDPAYKLAIMMLAPFAVDAPLVVPVEAAVSSEELVGVAKVEYAGGTVSDPFPFITKTLAGVAARKKGGAFKAAKATL